MKGLCSANSRQSLEVKGTREKFLEVKGTREKFLEVKAKCPEDKA